MICLSFKSVVWFVCPSNLYDLFVLQICMVCLSFKSVWFVCPFCMVCLSFKSVGFVCPSNLYGLFVL